MFNMCLVQWHFYVWKVVAAVEHCIVVLVNEKQETAAKGLGKYLEHCKKNKELQNRDLNILIQFGYFLSQAERVALDALKATAKGKRTSTAKAAAAPAKRAKTKAAASSAAASSAGPAEDDLADLLG